MNYYVVKYIGERREQTVWNALEENQVIVRKGETFLSNENEVARLRTLPELFEVVDEVNLKDMLKNAVRGSLRPWAHPHLSATRGKILFLFHSEGGNYIGEKIWEYQVALGLAGMGFGVHVLTDVIPPYAQEWPNANSVTWERSTATGFMGFDYVVGTSPVSMADALKYSRQNNVPCIIIAGEPISAIPGRRESIEKLAEYDKLYLQADMLVVPSETTRQLMVQKGADPEKIAIFQPTINPNLLLLTSKERKNEVVLCGRLDPHKELRPTVKSLLSSPDRFDITCLVPDAKALEEEFGEGNFNHRLRFFSDLTEKKKGNILSSAKVLVHPSRWEGFGITVLEALALGMNVIARPLTAFKETFGNDLLYFKNLAELPTIVSGALQNGGDTALATKYRLLAQEDKSAELEQIFSKKRISLPTNSTRVAIIGWSLAFGGGVVARIEQAKALEAAGYEVEMGSWGGKPEQLQAHEPELLNSPEDIKRWLMAKRPGTIICDGTLVPQVMPIAKDLGIPVAVFIHFWTPFFRKTVNLLDGDSKSIIDHKNARLLDDAFAVFSNSEYTHKVFKKHLGLSSTIVHPVFNKKRLDSKGRFTRKSILTPILEEEPNGLQLYEELMRALPNREFKVLYWRGSDDTLTRLKKEHSNLTVLEGVEDIGRHYRSAKIFLYTLQVDHTFGLSFAEALHCKTPVIAGRLGNVPNIVKKGGVLLDTIVIEDWITAIERCFTDDKFYKKLQNGAVEDAKKVPQTKQSVFVDKIQKSLERKRKVSLYCGDFLASAHAFKPYAKILKGVEIDAPNSENLIAFGPPDFWKHLISPNTYAYWASTPLQSELDKELRWLEDAVELVKKGELGGIISPLRGILLLAGAMGCKKCYQLSVPAPRLQPLKKIKRKKGHVSIFHSGQPRKNTVNSLLAILEVDPNITVHIAENVAKKMPKGLLDALSTVRHSFLEDDKYFALIASCSAGIQATVGETFNLAGFQHLALGTPCLISRSCAYWVDLPKEYEHLLIHNIDDYAEIAKALDFVLNAEHGDDYHEGLVEWAKWYAKKRDKLIKAQFARIFS